MSTTLTPPQSGPPPAPAPNLNADGSVKKPWYKQDFYVGRAVKGEELMNFSRQLASFLRYRDQWCRSPWCNASIRQADHVVGAASGVILLGLIQNILDLINAPNYWIDAINGAVILFALILARIIGGEVAPDILDVVMVHKSPQPAPITPGSGTAPGSSK